MTAQIAERLRYQGEDVAMCTNPLSDYFAMGGVNPRFESNCTALWRGYVGSWEIVNDRLYLIGLNGTLEGGAEASRDNHSGLTSALETTSFAVAGLEGVRCGWQLL